MSIPSEVKNYYDKGKRRLVDVVANGDEYSLILKYDDNETRAYELKNKLTGVLSVLKNKEKFNEVFIDSHGNIAWDIDKNVDSNLVFNNRIDLSADNAYIYGKQCKI